MVEKRIAVGPVFTHVAKLSNIYSTVQHVFYQSFQTLRLRCRIAAPLKMLSPFPSGMIIVYKDMAFYHVTLHTE